MIGERGRGQLGPGSSRNEAELRRKEPEQSVEAVTSVL